MQGASASGSEIWESYPGLEDGGGNIDIDPRFVEPVDPADAPTADGNLRLLFGSPAIDKGANTFVVGVSTDLDGEERIFDGNWDGAATADMGAYERQIYIYLPMVMSRHE